MIAYLNKLIRRFANRLTVEAVSVSAVDPCYFDFQIAGLGAFRVMENGVVIPMQSSEGIERTAKYIENRINDRPDDYGISQLPIDEDAVDAVYRNLAEAVTDMEISQCH